MADDTATKEGQMVAEMHTLAKLALRTDQAVYNVHTGLCIVPDVNGTGSCSALSTLTLRLMYCCLPEAMRCPRVPLSIR